jgi:hypothetical protein
MPKAGVQLPFTNDLRTDVQIVRRKKCDTVLLLFGDRRHFLGMTIPAMHRWFGGLPASLLYLRDFRRLAFLAGIASLGASRDATLDSLRKIIASLGGRRVLCFGNSGGVFAALHYGLDLQAEAVLAFAGTTNLSAEFNTGLRSAGIVARLAQGLGSTVDVDLRQLYARAQRPPRVRIVYGENNWDDRVQAEYLSGLPSVTLEPLQKLASHDAVIYSVIGGLFETQLNWLFGATVVTRRSKAPVAKNAADSP